MIGLGRFCIAHSFVVAGKVLRATHERQKNSDGGVHSLRSEPTHREACGPPCVHKADTALAGGPPAPTTNSCKSSGDKDPPEEITILELIGSVVVAVLRTTCDIVAM
jgi:hypothetical protein